MSQDVKYQKQRFLGAGERVDVFLGLNVAFDRNVAIKELRGGVETSDAERKGFYSEYEQWAKFENPRLARIADIDKTRAWVIQEYLPDSITDRSEEMMADMELAYAAIEQFLEGLAFLHAQGMMHCNLKDSNVRFINGALKICDGRCVKIGFPGSLPKPRGSNRYLAPEMINEEFGSVGTASDIYVAGIILLESLAGPKFETLFQGYVSGTPDAEMGWVRWHNSTDSLDKIHATCPSIPEPLANLLDDMLCKEVRMRHANAERLLTELRESREAILTAPRAVPVTSKQKPDAASDKPKDEKEEQKQIKLIDRPISPAYIRLLSGSLAGSIFPVAMGEIVVGGGDRCNVRLSPEQYPEIQSREIKISLGGNGWLIADPQHHPLIVDGKKTFDPISIRSGSIFRLTPSGPDLQFVVQGDHSWTWQDIASELKLRAPDSHAVPARLLKKENKKRRDRTESPAAPAKVAPSPPSPPTPVETKGSKRKAKSAPPNPAPSASPSPSAPAPPPATSAAPSAAPSAPVSPAKLEKDKPSDKESFVERFKKMDQSKKNNYILIIALPIVAILVILFVPRSKPSDTPKDKTPAVANDNSDANKKESSENDGASNGDTTNEGANTDGSSDSGEDTSGDKEAKSNDADPGTSSD